MKHGQEIDLGMADRFLSSLVGDGLVTFQTFDDSKAQRQDLIRVAHGTLGNHSPTLTTINRNGGGVFVMVNEGDGKGRKGENVVAVRALFVDLDGAPLEPVQRCPLEPHLVIESSPGRYHAYWLVRDCPLGEFNIFQHALAMKFNGDQKVKDLPRVMRLPGFLHQKGAPFVTRILRETGRDGYRRQEVIEGLELKGQLSSNPRTTRMHSGKKSIAKSGELIEGERDDGIFRYAFSLRAKGLARTAAEQMVLLKASQCQPPFPQAEARKCLDSAWSYDFTQREELTDYGNARRLVRRYGADIRFVVEFKVWVIWNGVRWAFDNDFEIERYVKDMVMGIYQEIPENRGQEEADALSRHARKSQQLPRLKAAIELARSEPDIPIHQSMLDCNHDLLCVENGVLDLHTGALRESCKEDYITKRAFCSYDTSADCPLFLTFLDRIMGGNADLIAYLQRAIGYSLTGHTGEQCLFIAHGNGANGKGTLMNLLKELMGDYAMQSPVETFMARKNNNDASSDLARLRGARLVNTSETESGQRLAESLIKQLTGQDPIAARFLYGEYFEYLPSFKIWMATNHKPIISGDDAAIWRRIHLIPFTISIPPRGARQASWRQAAGGVSGHIELGA